MVIHDVLSNAGRNTRTGHSFNFRGPAVPIFEDRYNKGRREINTGERPGEYPLMGGKLPNRFLFNFEGSRQVYDGPMAQKIELENRGVGYKNFRLESLPYGESESAANKTSLGNVPQARAFYGLS